MPITKQNFPLKMELKSATCKKIITFIFAMIKEIHCPYDVISVET